MTFFFDNNLSIKLVKGLREFGEDVQHLKDHFPEETEDSEWLEYVGKNQFTLITRDKRIRWNPAELAALKKFKVGAFFLSSKSLDRCKIIQQLVRHWPRMKEYARKTEHPFAFRIPTSGTKFRAIQL